MFSKLNRIIYPTLSPSPPTGRRVVSNQDVKKALPPDPQKRHYFSFAICKGCLREKRRQFVLLSLPTFVVNFVFLFSPPPNPQTRPTVLSHSLAHFSQQTRFVRWLCASHTLARPIFEDLPPPAPAGHFLGRLSLTRPPPPPPDSLVIVVRTLRFIYRTLIYLVAPFFCTFYSES